MKEQDYLIVDLGLPSGLKWADRNVGAETPQDNGLYFDWGNVDGHAVENGNTTDGYSFDENTYSTTLGGQYIDSELDAEHDAATVNMGSEWRMPTSDEIIELVENTDHYYIGLNGELVAKSELDGSIELRSICFVKNGEEFDYNDRSNFIEFPFAGFCFGSLLGGEGRCCSVCSSSAYNSDGEKARYLNFDFLGFIDDDHCFERFIGFSVRGVIF